MKQLLLSLLVVISTFCNGQILSVNLVDVNTDQSENLMDGVGVFFNPMWSDNVNLDDAQKLTNPGENIGILRNGYILAIEKRITFDTIPLILWNMNNLPHRIKITSSGTVAAYLEDTLLHTITPMVNGSLQYCFTGIDTIYRFRIIFLKVLAIQQNEAYSPNIEKTKFNFSVYPNPSTSGYFNLNFKNLPVGRYSVRIYNYFLSKCFLVNNIYQAAQQINTYLPPGNYYMLLSDNESINITKQISIR